MANPLFRSQRGGFLPADTVNEAGGAAYSLSPEALLAQLAATCTFGDSCYISAEDQLRQVIAAANKVSPEFEAKTAVFARKRGFMKDMPALLACHLSAREDGKPWLEKVFPQVIDNGRMLTRFFEILWSNVVGRKNIGHHTRRLVQQLFDRVPPAVLFKWNVGKPSLKDIITMMHPKPATPEHDALFGYLLGKDVGEKYGKLPELVKQYEGFKAMKQAIANGIEPAPSGLAMGVPEVPFQMLDGLAAPLTTAEWAELFKSGGWHFVRMNLNTAMRHGVFENQNVVRLVADRLRDPEAIRRSRVFPYQLLMAYKAAENVPTKISNALHDALEIAVENVPELAKRIAVCIDTSGSMSWSVTGSRGSATSKVAAVDTAGLIAAAILRKNPEDTIVVPFDTQVHMVRVDPRDSVMTNAQKLALHGGGTNCACALQYLNAQQHKGDLVVYVSDNAAWVETPGAYAGPTGMLSAWNTYKRRNPRAKLVNINIQVATSMQTPENHPDIYQIGGFSDQVFTLIADWVAGRTSDYWVETIKQLQL